MHVFCNLPKLIFYICTFKNNFVNIILKLFYLGKILINELVQMETKIVN
jgi:hypothetical protein